MSFLPIVERELRVAARRRSTFRIRRWTAFLAMFASMFFIFYAWIAGPAAGPGALLFGLLSGYAIFLCLLSGVFITADCLSQEKREGTLGLLFLTDLKGYDVVLGKFFATSLNSFYGLLAIFPMLALPLLLGGVTGGEFWRTTLALLNALFFSLALGIWVSSLSRDAQRAMAATFALLVLSVVLLPLIKELSSSMQRSALWEFVCWLSPIQPFTTARGGASHEFWGSLLISNFVAWALLISAALILPRAWQDENRGQPGGKWRGRLRPSTRGKEDDGRKRAHLLSINPILWLMSDRPGVRWVVWSLIAFWSGTVAILSIAFPGGPALDLLYGPMRGFGLMWAFSFVLKMLIAIQASRFFAEARRNGALEMLLASPVTSEEILRGQWLAIYRVFLAPIGVFVVVGFTPAAISVLEILNEGTYSELIPRLWGFGMQFYQIAVNGVAAFFAVGWVGMWLALSMRRPALAGGMTIVFVLVLAEILICIPGFVISLLFIAWARTRLITDFRKMLYLQYQSSWGRVTNVPRAAES